MDNMKFVCGLRSFLEPNTGFMGRENLAVRAPLGAWVPCRLGNGTVCRMRFMGGAGFGSGGSR